MAIIDEIVYEADEEEEETPDVAPADLLMAVPVSTVENLLPTKAPSKLLWISRFSGIFYALTASFMFTSSTFVIKKLGVDMLDAFLFRFILQSLSACIFAKSKHYSLFSGSARQITFQLLCCGTGAAGFFLFFIAIRYAELSDVSTLGYTRVVWTVVLSVIVYRERPLLATLIALPLTLLGVMFVTQPSFLFPKSTSITTTTTMVSYGLRMLGFGLAFTGALTSAANVLLFKQLISTSKDIKASVLNFQYSFIVLIFLIVYQFYKIFILHFNYSVAYFLSWRYLLASAVCLVSILATVLNQKAIKREHPAIFSLLGSADIIVALILQNLFTSIRSNLFALLGSTLVISSVVVIGIARIVNERREQNKSITIDERNGKC